ncbi:hypothetical protein B9L19_01925 [Geobacillus thermocatenulatus]|uniref:Uncharacterized protein n=1 Tax=Geobacillus thermocatenulatus TaxID=33938 RepID=A0A226Q8Y0_9BACL|nr:hypothetical protein GT3921_10010 [Geobacillus thermocatenulatus]OXB88886.1 hypothetical protein B9L19_01925 [Geobacillus thermocatenulatus]
MMPLFLALEFQIGIVHQNLHQVLNSIILYHLLVEVMTETLVDGSLMEMAMQFHPLMIFIPVKLIIIIPAQLKVLKLNCRWIHISGFQ